MVRVLLIEDNIEILENILELLEMEGYKVITAVNGKEGLEKIFNSRPDLIICDILMPQVDGYEVLKEVGKYNSTNVIPLYLYAKSEKSDIRKGLDLGADDYLTKPFEFEDLLQSIEGCLNKKKILLERYDTPEELNTHISRQRAHWIKTLIQ